MAKDTKSTHLIALSSARGELKTYDAWIRRSCSRWLHKDYLKTLEGVQLEPMRMRDVVTISPPVMRLPGRLIKHKHQGSRSPQENRFDRRADSPMAWYKTRMHGLLQDVAPDTQMNK